MFFTYVFSIIKKLIRKNNIYTFHNFAFEITIRGEKLSNLLGFHDKYVGILVSMPISGYTRRNPGFPSLKAETPSNLFGFLDIYIYIYKKNKSLFSWLGS